MITLKLRDSVLKHKQNIWYILIYHKDRYLQLLMKALRGYICNDNRDEHLWINTYNY